MDNGTIEIVICGHQLNHDYLLDLRKIIENKTDRCLNMVMSNHRPEQGIVLYANKLIEKTDVEMRTPDEFSQ